MSALWEQSLVYTRRVSTSVKNDVNDEETIVDGMESKIKDCVLKPEKVNMLVLSLLFISRYTMKKKKTVMSGQVW